MRPRYVTKNFLFLYPDPVNADAFVMDGLGVLKDAAAFFNDTDGRDIFFRAAEHYFFHSHITGIVQSQLQNGGAVSFAALRGTDGITDMPAVFPQDLLLQIVADIGQTDDFVVVFTHGEEGRGGDPAFVSGAFPAVAVGMTEPAGVCFLRSGREQFLGIFFVEHIIFF